MTQITGQVTNVYIKYIPDFNDHLTNLKGSPAELFFYILSTFSGKMAVEKSSLEVPCGNKQSREVHAVRTACKKGKPATFSAQEIASITQKCEKSQCSNTNTNKIRHIKREEMAIAVNAVETAH